MKYLTYATLMIFLLTAGGCNHDHDTEISEVKVLYLNHYKSECGSFVLALCFQSRISENDEWSFFYDAIEGFEYEWGYIYKLKVNVGDVENPPQDSSSLKYTLLEIVEKVKEPTTSLFDISVSRASGLVTKEYDNVYMIYEDKELSCITADCETIDSLIAQDMAILFEFSHQSDPAGPLMVVQIKCSSSRESFRDSCM